MIEPARGWSIVTRHESVLVIPPGGPARGGIRYRDRMRPLEPFQALVRKHVEQPGFELDSVGPMERLVTREGEHAVLVTARGRQGKRVVQRDLGFVLLDDAYARISCIAIEEADFTSFSQVVRETILGDRHFLGVRRRWFEYIPPPGWRSRPRGFAAEWTPPAFPRERGLLVVWPALPRLEIGGIEGAFDGLFGAQGHDVVTVDEVPPAAMVAASGLTGQQWHLVRSSGKGPSLHTHAIALEDDRYVYPMRLELSDDAQPMYRDVLVQVARTIVAVPRPGLASDTLPEGIWNE